MKLIATKPMRYGTRHLVAGEAFETEKDLHGQILIVTRKAKKAAGPGRPRKPVSEPAVEHPILVEEQKADEPVAEVAPDAPDQSEAPRPGRPLPRTAHPFRGPKTP